jgi:dihydrofolate reductase
MGRLIEITFMSIDGVIDAPDLTQHVMQYIMQNKEHEDYQNQWLSDADTLLLGRKTYEFFAEAYPKMEQTDMGSLTEFVKRMNRISKHVASNTLQETKWNATIINEDLAHAVEKIKNDKGMNIIKYGTGTVDKTLFEHKLVDLLCLVIYPFVLGHGTHLFEDLGLTTHMELSNIKRFENGTMVLEYIPKY